MAGQPELFFFFIKHESSSLKARARTSYRTSKAVLSQETLSGARLIPLSQNGEHLNVARLWDLLQLRSHRCGFVAVRHLSRDFSRSGTPLSCLRFQAYNFVARPLFFAASSKANLLYSCYKIFYWERSFVRQVIRVD
jgi:hypothetical protein